MMLWAADVALSPVQLPTYPFEHRYCWLNPSKYARYQRHHCPQREPLIVLKAPSEPEELELSEQALAAPEANEILTRLTPVA